MPLVTFYGPDPAMVLTDTVTDGELVDTSSHPRMTIEIGQDRSVLVNTSVYKGDFTVNVRQMMASHTCHTCNQTFSRSYNLKRHVQRKHGNEQSLYPLHPFAKHPQLQSKEAIQVQTSASSSHNGDQKSHDCMRCGHMFNTTNAVQRHAELGCPMRKSKTSTL